MIKKKLLLKKNSYNWIRTRPSKLAATFGAKVQDSFFEKIAAQYDLTDAVEISSGGVFYQSGDTEKFGQIGDNDRVYFEIKYSF